MATFAAFAGVKLPEKDLEGQPCIFDSYDMSPILLGTGKSARESWFYFTEDELSPGAIHWHNYKFVFNLRGDDGAPTGGLAVDTNLGWKGANKYIATVPQTFDLWQDPQERYDIFMNNYTERTWTGVVMSQEFKKVMETFAMRLQIQLLFPKFTKEQEKMMMEEKLKQLDQEATPPPKK